MDNYKKIKVINSTYVCNTNSSSNYYNKDNLLVGAINSKNKHFKLYKSLLKISKSDFKLDSNKSIYLFLFVENMYVSNENSIDFSIFGNDDDFITSNITWFTFPEKSIRTHVDVSISLESIKKYIKIDITPIIKSLTSYSRSYNLMLEVIAPSNLPYMIQFDSCNGENLPFLAVADNSNVTAQGSNNQDTGNNSNNNNNNNNNNLEKADSNSYLEEFYAKILDRMSSQNQKLDFLDKSLNNVFNSLEAKISSVEKDDADSKNKVISELTQITENFSDINKTMTSLKNYFETLKNEANTISEAFPVSSLNNIASDLNELTKNEILHLKNSVNDDIVNLRNSINSDISNLNNYIKNLNNSLIELSNQVSKMSSATQNVIFEPLNKENQ